MNATTFRNTADLYKAFEQAEDNFIAVYTLDPNRGRIRPGDFRYMSRKHSPATTEAANAFQEAAEAWRNAVRAERGK
jgi:hypothetical protein